MTDIPSLNCPNCGAALPTASTLVCPDCGALVHSQELTQLASAAAAQEQHDPRQAIAIWQQCLSLLPPKSQQYAIVQARINQLQSAFDPGGTPRAPSGPRQETLSAAVTKTGISMLISIVFYQFMFGWIGAVGFVLLILVHEMGHVMANLYYGLPASPPIFIPFVGAIINLRGQIPNAKVEAIVGIAGPVAGTIGALAVFAWYLTTKSEVPLELAWFGFTINLFNLLPVPPLDGGHVAAALSPWIWLLGLAGLGLLLVDEFLHGHIPILLILVLIYSLPQVIQTLKYRKRLGHYFNIGKTAPIVIGTAYLILLAALLVLRIYTEQRLPQSGMF